MAGPLKNAKHEYYVYALVDPRDDSTFYIGKGIGRRAYTHAPKAKTFSGAKWDNPRKVQRIQEIQASGNDVIVRIIHSGLDEREAFLLESVLSRCL